MLRWWSAVSAKQHFVISRNNELVVNIIPHITDDTSFGKKKIEKKKK